MQNKTDEILNVSYSCFYSRVKESDAQNYYLMSQFWGFFLAVWLVLLWSFSVLEYVVCMCFMPLVFPESVHDWPGPH